MRPSITRAVRSAHRREPKIADALNAAEQRPPFILRAFRGLTPPLIWRYIAPLFDRPRRENASAADRIEPEEPAPPTDDHLSPNEIALYSQAQPNALSLDGVVYTSIFNPLDGRKNWKDMVSAFIWAHKRNADATLIIKTPNLDVHDFIDPLIDFLKRFMPFDCRIVVLKSFLDDAQYRQLLTNTTYYVNTSFGEGQCLPLMEFLSAGVPAVAPDTTALADYMEPGMSFVVPSHAEPSTWQHDPRLSYRAIRYRVDWLKLVAAFEESYDLAKKDEPAWREMGAAAAKRLQLHCSLDEAEQRLRAFLDAAPLMDAETPDA